MKKAFTIVEVVVVIMILALLLAVLLPSLQKAKELRQAKEEVLRRNSTPISSGDNVWVYDAPSENNGVATVLRNFNRGHPSLEITAIYSGKYESNSVIIVTREKANVAVEKGPER